MNKFATALQKNNMIEVSDISFIYTNNWDRYTYVKWVGGRNGSGTPQLPRRGKKNQIAARSIFMEYYDDAAGGLYSKNHLYVKTSDKYNMNPYNMILENHNADKNDPDKYCDVTDMNDCMARRAIKAWIARN